MELNFDLSYSLMNGIMKLQRQTNYNRLTTGKVSVWMLMLPTVAISGVPSCTLSTLPNNSYLNQLFLICEGFNFRRIADLIVALGQLFFWRVIHAFVPPSRTPLGSFLKPSRCCNGWSCRHDRWFDFCTDRAGNWAGR
jgi:hypothetical protein